MEPSVKILMAVLAMTTSLVVIMAVYGVFERYFLLFRKDWRKGVAIIIASLYCLLPIVGDVWLAQKTHTSIDPMEAAPNVALFLVSFIAMRYRIALVSVLITLWFFA